LKLKRDGEFYLKNVGKREIYINGKPVESGEKRRLIDNCLIEICELRFIFEINKSLWNKIRKQLF